jgi:hypothetical protein
LHSQSLPRIQNPSDQIQSPSYRYC